MPLNAAAKLRIFHGFYRPGEESAYCFDIREAMAKGHDFRDYICPDSMERHKDYLQIGSRYCRILYLKDYASFLKDSMVTRLTDVSRSLMLSIDFIPVPMDEAIKEAERRVLGVETNVHNWQRRQNSQGNFGSEPPYDMKLQRQGGQRLFGRSAYPQSTDAAGHPHHRPCGRQQGAVGQRHG